MKSLTTHLTNIVRNAFTAAGYDPKYGEVVVSKRPDLSQFQCNGALPAAKQYKQRPRDIAQAVVEQLAEQTLFSKLELAGPGFINVSLTDDFLAGWMSQVNADERLGVPAIGQSRKVIVDYGGANVAKPMHVGHLRAGIIGESLKRLFRWMGDDVTGDVHLGDWGTQMGQVIAEIARREPDHIYFNANYHGPYPDDSPITLEDLEELYPAASGRAKSDPEFAEKARQATAELQNGRSGYLALWQHFWNVSVAGLKEDYGKLEIEYDLWHGESTVRDRVDPLVERLKEDGFAYESNGALVMDVAKPDDKAEIKPIMLRKSDGAVLYGTTDMATIEDRVEEINPDLMLYVVDGRQQYHFVQVFRASQKGNVVGDHVGLEHNYFGTMNGKDGKPFKTREGGVMKLRDLIALVNTEALKRMEESNVAADYDDGERQEVARMVGLAALKFSDLINQRTKDYVFDLERFSSFEGKTGPYLLYTTVRAKSILRKAEAQGLAAGSFLPPSVDAERDLMLFITQLPTAVQQAYDLRLPNHLAEYVYGLANAFNRFYNACHILREENAAQQASWLALTALYVRVAEQVLFLLGIPVPERM